MCRYIGACFSTDRLTVHTRQRGIYLTGPNLLLIYIQNMKISNIEIIFTLEMERVCELDNLFETSVKIMMH